MIIELELAVIILLLGYGHWPSVERTWRNWSDRRRNAAEHRLWEEAARAGKETEEKQ